MEFDCVYGLDLHRDERVLSLKILSNRVASFPSTDPSLADARTGRAVEHALEGEHSLRMSGEGWSWAKLLSRVQLCIT